MKVYHIYYSKFKHMFFSQETTKCKTLTGNGIKIVNILYFLQSNDEKNAKIYNSNLQNFRVYKIT